MATDELGEDIAAYAAEPIEMVDADGWLLPPQNADDANRILRRLRSHEARREELVERWRAEVQMLDAWLADRASGIDRDIERLTLSLEGWMRDREATTGVVTEHLPAGELWLRQGRPSLTVEDEVDAIDWSKANNVHVRTKVEVDKAALALVVKPGGAVSVTDAGPDHEFRVAIDAEGDPVPGVLIRVAKRRTFTVHPYKENHE